MSKFEELAEMATKYSRHIFDVKRTSQRLAAQLVTGYAQFLGCPLAQIDFVRLAKNLDATEQSHPFGSDVPLVLDTEGFWYFCVRIKFEKPSDGAFVFDQTTLGIRYQNGLLTVRHDRDFEVSPDCPESANPLYQYLVEGTEKEFSSPFRLQCKRIGFVL